MEKCSNLILIDFPKIEDWEFKKLLNETTNLVWEEAEAIREGKIKFII